MRALATILIMAFAALTLAGCTDGPDDTPLPRDPSSTPTASPTPTAPPAPDHRAWTVFDSVGGFAGPDAPTQQRLVITEDGRAVSMRWGGGDGDVTVEPDLQPFAGIITDWMQPTGAARTNVHVYQVTVLHLADDAFSAHEQALAAFAADAGTGASDHPSMCADCQTHSFHHLRPPAHASDAYGTADEFDSPWREWAMHMQALAADVRNDGTPLEHA